MKNNNGLEKRRFMTQNEINLILNAVSTGTYAVRNRCLVLLCFIHGLRASEICRLRISDIDLKDKCIHIYRLKKGFSTTHPLLEEEIRSIKSWLKIRLTSQHSETEWLFLSRKGNPLLHLRQTYRATVGEVVAQNIGSTLRHVAQEFLA